MNNIILYVKIKNVYSLEKLSSYMTNGPNINKINASHWKYIGIYIRTYRCKY